VRVAVIVVGVVILLIGAVFAGQGLGYISGSPMTNDHKWFWIGGAMVVVGLALGAAGFLGRPRKQRQA
jgi:xanthine/uracil permease